MNESGYIQTVHKKLPESIDAWKIATPYHRGIADTHYDGPTGKSIWIEWKYLPKLPKRDDTLITPDLSELQKRWLERKATRNHNVAVILACPLGGVIYRYPEWNRPTTLAVFRSRLKDKKTLTEWIVSEVL